MTRTENTALPRRGPARRATARRSTGVVAAVAATGLFLTGCAEEVPQPVADEPFTGPVMTADQETAVVQAVAGTVEEADAELDPKLLDPRVTGPAREVRASQIKVAKSREDDSLVTTIPTDLQRMIIPTTETWPRVSFTITEETENLEVPRLVSYEQASARDNYKMRSWVQLIPGTTMPNFADPEVIGSDAVDAEDDSLVVTPTQALNRYADLVANGTDDSEHAGQFELPSDSPDLVQRVQADASNVRGDDNFQDADGSYKVAFASRGGEVVAVRTSDGGALVMGVLDGNVRATVEDDGEIGPLTDTQKALIGDEDNSNELYVEYTDQVALYVPPADSEEKIRPLGYSHVPTDASTSIPDKKDRNTAR